MAFGGGRSDRGRPERRAPRKITADYLQRAAMHYLERYAAPAAQLRRVLARKVALSCRHHEQDPAIFEPMLDEVVARCVSSGLVDDQRFAQARAATLKRKGRSSRAVEASLSAKGVPRELAREASAGSEEDELAAARKAARRKRLGPWSRGDRAASRQKDLAALARAGFNMTIARAVIDGAGEEAMQD
ncbi:MAG TPA: regulatory protein RecX [Bosea sp. (in: a-proteobacteria)]|jgi:regulatory protein|uniref:regulatory protein RecX n=1 Tax=Bosea sp. (in: a-proteobacteria) TaxID=1871050 RepID=UPI002DDCBB22|nr:regulatory protein RecX [Bosea sp. (in: a-proteobacteria)]HEV2552237.1 regulatory protein RecX [Bosea sp. (in: a-proteobacteria)]